MSQSDWNSKNFALYVLGAGFSCHAQLPLAAELWSEVRRRALLIGGRGEKFQEDLKDFIQFRNLCFGDSLTEDTVDFEQFLGYLDLEFQLGLRGSDTWSDEGNESQLIVKNLIGQVLTERMPLALPDAYLRFAERLRPHDHVFTLNYDLLLERSLEAVGRPYRLFSDRYKSVSDDGAILDDSHEEVVVLKLHGSVDWFDKASHLKVINEWRKQGYEGIPSHPIFNSQRNLETTPLVSGPRFPRDPLQHVHRVQNVKAYYSRPDFFLSAPVLLAPSPAKALYFHHLREFLHGTNGIGVLNFDLSIIGYSLPSHDDYAVQFLYQMVMNYQTAYWDREIMDGKRKALAKFVDMRSDERGRQDFIGRYAFVDRERARFHFDGFDLEAFRAVPESC